MTSIAQISENEQSEITGTVKLPFSQFFEQLVCRIIPDAKTTEKIQELDERLLGSPALALNQCRQVLGHMAGLSIHAFRDSTACVLNYDKVIADHAVNILESAEEIASKKCCVFRRCHRRIQNDMCRGNRNTESVFFCIFKRRY